MPKVIPIRTKVSTHNRAFLIYFLSFGNPIFNHLISSGSGALYIITPLIGKLLYLHKFQKFFHDGGLFNMHIYSTAFEDLNVKKTIFFSPKGASLKETISY